MDGSAIHYAKTRFLTWNFRIQFYDLQRGPPSYLWHSSLLWFSLCLIETRARDHGSVAAFKRGGEMTAYNINNGAREIALLIKSYSLYLLTLVALPNLVNMDTVPPCQGCVWWDKIWLPCGQQHPPSHGEHGLGHFCSCCYSPPQDKLAFQYLFLL